ncbi:MAG TPA: alkaline phosphatase family protein, partial [Terricaulis sp.]|nr:alkaline phosphatase family protein [Terricaulis sp.]
GSGRVVWDGPLAGVQPIDGADISHLAGVHQHGECLRKEDAATRWGFGAHVRVPAVICLAEVGWRYRSAQIPPYRTPSLGAHGYDPAAPEMASLFIAYGPAFRAGVELPAFDSVSVYPLLADLIGVEPAANEGDLAATAPARAAHAP